MKILLVYRDLTQGGVQRIIVHVANYLAIRGYEVTLLLGVVKGPYLDLLNENIKIISPDTKNRFYLLRYLISYLRSNKSDILFTGVPSFNILAIIAKYWSATDTKVVISEHSNTIEEFRMLPWSIYKLSFLFIPIFYRFADSIISVSSGVANDLSKFAKIPLKKISVIYNPAYNDHLLSEAEQNVEEIWLTSKDYPVIMGVGRLTDQKNFSALIDAVYNVSLRRKVKLIIVGEGHLHDELLYRINSYKMGSIAKLIGFKKNPVAWINKADVFVLSSKWEGFGVILVEALAAGTTIVSTDCKSGPAEILQNGKLGYIVPASDIDALAKKIEFAIDNPISKDLLIEGAKQYDENKIMKCYEEIFNKLNPKSVAFTDLTVS
ncbi:glycosyltransferase [Larkinella sp. GY13]|uniref:glycosyltransferase n=1 Tax=Larkinella sp. GY13 TaxID=3453720 RepID=UPI003EEDB214